MSNTPFLLQVARYYADVPSLEDYCFVFPNRRSGQFFAHYLQRQLLSNVARRPHLLPCVTAINDFIAEFTGTASATDIEMMFALYDAYSQAMGNDAQEFDKFIYWAQLIISDYNDIDKSLTDADGVYRNLSDLHDLSSNYLSPEVQDKVKKIFGDSLFTAFLTHGPMPTCGAVSPATIQRRRAMMTMPQESSRSLRACGEPCQPSITTTTRR